MATGVAGTFLRMSAVLYCSSLATWHVVSWDWVLGAPSGAHLDSREWNVVYVGIYAIVIMKLLLPIVYKPHIPHLPTHLRYI